ALLPAITSLKPPLHPPPNQLVMSILKQIATIDNLHHYLHQTFANKHKIIPFPHPLYKHPHPTPKYLTQITPKITQQTPQTQLFQISLPIHKTIKEEKPLIPNLDFFSPTL
ncbi:citrate/2-methylcitrate synthase, partial [Staphylococcus epidermidis]|uniref:citrate/2-methylcitrate synthase n=1 Tax=Staphylococcus epidermidis TaxID=1282 RepID=UPI0028CB786F